MLKSSLTNPMSSPPWLSTTGVENWFAEAPFPSSPGLSGTTAVCAHTEVAGSAVGIESVCAAWIVQ